MVLDEMKNNPDARPVIFVLSDGKTNQGYDFNRAAQIIESLGITVNTIGYNADLDELAKLSKINESVSINADSDNVTYKLKELSYLPHLQKYFKLDSVPFDTKMICIFEKRNNVPNHSNINQTQI